MEQPVSNAEKRCDFCAIIAGELPREIRYEDDEFVVFRNKLEWAPVMWLVVPRRHMGQMEFWTSPLFERGARLAVAVGEQDAPGGFRIVSNFGDDAAQSQSHGHLHVLGGADLGLYMDWPGKGDYRRIVYGGRRASAPAPQAEAERRK